jgi:hypothetical protein
MQTKINVELTLSEVTAIQSALLSRNKELINLIEDYKESGSYTMSGIGESLLKEINSIFDKFCLIANEEGQTQ